MHVEEKPVMEMRAIYAGILPHPNVTERCEKLTFIHLSLFLSEQHCLLWMCTKTLQPHSVTTQESDDPSSPPKPLWQSLLDFAADQGVDALIDCGALLAGVKIR